LAAAAERRKAEAEAESLVAAIESAKQLARKEQALRRAAHNKVLELQGNIRVFARIRPVLPVETKSGQGRVIAHPVEDNGIEVRYNRLAASMDDSAAPLSPAAEASGMETHSFKFDQVFGPSST